MRALRPLAIMQMRASLPCQCRNSVAAIVPRIILNASSRLNPYLSLSQILYQRTFLDHSITVLDTRNDITLTHFRWTFYFVIGNVTRKLPSHLRPLQLPHLCILSRLAQSINHIDHANLKTYKILFTILSLQHSFHQRVTVR